MVYYKMEKKELIIPSGFGTLVSGGSSDCREAIAEAYQSGYTEGYNAGQDDCPECDCTEAYAEGRQSGMTEQAAADAARLTTLQATQNGNYTAPYGYSEVSVNVPTTSILQEGEYDIDENFAGASGPIYPDAGYNGFSSFSVSDEGYGNAKYNEGYEDGTADAYSSVAGYGARIPLIEGTIRFSQNYQFSNNTHIWVWMNAGLQQYTLEDGYIEIDIDGNDNFTSLDSLKLNGYEIDGGTYNFKAYVGEGIGYNDIDHFWIDGPASDNTDISFNTKLYFYKLTV